MNRQGHEERRPEETGTAGTTAGQEGGTAKEGPGDLLGGRVEEREARRADLEHLRELQRQRRARVVKALVAAGLAVLFIVFVVSNAEPTRVDFVFLKARPRLIWVMFACAVVGGIIGYLIGRPGRGERLHGRPEERGDRDRP
jgi:uncharacterized integral membrane protein